MNDREPRPGSRMAQVLPFVRQGLRDREIAMLLHIDESIIKGTRSNLGRLGVLGDLKLREQQRRTAISLAQGGTWVLARPFVELQMSNVEVAEAIKQTSGFEVRSSLIAYSVKGAAKGIREWNGKQVEINQVVSESKAPSNVIAERVKFWLEASKVLGKNEEATAQLPHTRKEWLLLSKYSALCQRVYDAPDEVEEARREAEERTFLAALDDKTRDILQISFNVLHNHYVPITHPELTQLFEQGRRKIWMAVFNIVGDKDIAEDVVAETFYRAWDQRSKYKRLPNIPLSAWVTTIAKHAALDYLKKHDNRPHNDLNEQIEAGKESDFEEGIAENVSLREAFRRLPKHLREILIMKFEQGLSVEEMAKEIEKSTTTVKNRTSQALESLRTLMST